MKVDINKGICTDFGITVLDGCRDYYENIPLVDLSIHFLPFHIQELSGLKLVRLCMEFII